MFRQLDFRSFFNFLGRNKLYTAINIFGLSLSLMFVILIADYTVRTPHPCIRPMSARPPKKEA